MNAELTPQSNDPVSTILAGIKWILGNEAFRSSYDSGGERWEDAEVKAKAPLVKGEQGYELEFSVSNTYDPEGGLINGVLSTGASPIRKSGQPRQRPLREEFTLDKGDFDESYFRQFDTARLERMAQIIAAIRTKVEGAQTEVKPAPPPPSL